ncbi:MAG: InlB B-repeat-containing protein [Clostridia bacterium]|nr:InlB B-repeat-containing protein [Clostridia bacterium]
MRNAKKTISLLLCAVLTLWCFAFPGAAGEALPESEHPYQNDFTGEWDCGVPGAEGFYLTFSEDTFFEWGSLTFTNITNGETETYSVPEWRELRENYRDMYIAISVLVTVGVIKIDEKPGDVLTLTCGENEIGEFSGDELAGRTLYIPSDSVHLTLTTDSDGTEKGFTVTGISADAPQGVKTVSYSYDGRTTDKIVCFGEGETVTAAPVGRVVDGRACIGWSDESGGELKYDGGKEIETEKDLTLYAVYEDIILKPEEAFNFNNDYDPFTVDSYSFTDEGEEIFRYIPYYMSDEDYAAMLKNLCKVYALSPAMYPLAGADLALAASFPLRNFMGACYGISVTSALQHFGMIDMLSMQEEAQNVRDLEPTPELVSLINYYQAQATRSMLTDNAAVKPGSAAYTWQLKKLYETVKAGNLVRFGFSLLQNPTPNHEILIVGAYDDLNGNHVLLTYDSNYGSEFAGNNIVTTFVINPDFTYMESKQYNYVYCFYWSDDFSGFESVNVDGSGDPFALQKSFIERIKAFFVMLTDLLKNFFGSLFSK